VAALKALAEREAVPATTSTRPSGNFASRPALRRRGAAERGRPALPAGRQQTRIHKKR